MLLGSTVYKLLSTLNCMGSRVVKKLNKAQAWHIITDSTYSSLATPHAQGWNQKVNSISLLWIHLLSKIHAQLEQKLQRLPRCPVQLSSVRIVVHLTNPVHVHQGISFVFKRFNRMEVSLDFQLFQVGDLCFIKSFFPLCLQNTVKMMKALFWRLLTFTGLNIIGGDVDSPSLAELFPFFPLASCFRVLRSSFLELSC